MKLKNLIPGLALVLFLACPLTAAAQPAAPNAAALEKLESLQDQLWAKGAELKALQQAGNVQETRAAASEMNKLKTQIREERRKLGDAGPGRERGEPRGPGEGWGPGPRGKRGSGGGGCPCWE
jgi:hypothetical protein